MLLAKCEARYRQAVTLRRPYSYSPYGIFRAGIIKHDTEYPCDDAVQALRYEYCDAWELELPVLIKLTGISRIYPSTEFICAVSLHWQGYENTHAA
jgi:hypothetical protein